MDKQPKPLADFIKSLVSAVESGKLAIAKHLSNANKAGYKVSQIARQWKSADSDALGEDSIKKYILAYDAHSKGADFSKVLKGLNNGTLKAETVVELETDNLPSELVTPSKEGKRSDSDPAVATKKALDAIVARVKADKLPITTATKLLNETVAEITKLAHVTGHSKKVAA